ncbi:hypothetical protein DUI87_05133 [Hirundo rustica rustica]|uniref:Uncharacterized protein n=1 Tax=Hirundo rustica rustica TaxID=333673 RepID=A0A3M0KZV8_HIRRU|nr:hypothetical protein DUI87_05133 [Hirundo rustica rustica]
MNSRAVIVLHGLSLTGPALHVCSPGVVSELLQLARLQHFKNRSKVELFHGSRGRARSLLKNRVLMGSHVPLDVHLLLDGILHGLPVWSECTGPQWTPPQSLGLKFMLEFQPVQYGSTGAQIALGILQPTHFAMSVTKGDLTAPYGMGKESDGNDTSLIPLVKLEKQQNTIWRKIVLRGTVDSLKGSEALQRDLNKLERWAITSLVELNKDKYWILHLGWGNPGCTVRLGNERVESSTAERDPDVLVSGKLNLSQQCPGSQEGRPCPGVHQAQNHQLGERGDSPALLWGGLTSSPEGSFGCCKLEDSVLIIPKIASK